MKRVLSALISLSLVFFMTTCTFTEKPPPPDYLDLMAQAAAAGDIEGGRAIEVERLTFLEENGLDEEVICFDDLYLLSQYIFLKAGEPRLSQELRVCTGELALNRMASPEFANTMRGVFLQMGDEVSVLSRPGLTSIVPSRVCVDAAMRLLLGERVMEPSVVYQRYERKGDIFAVFADKLLGFTYFCRSEHQELYPVAANLAQSMGHDITPDAVAG